MNKIGKVIGILGGMSWESTAEYYRLLNQLVKARLGGHHSARIILYSVDFAEIEALQRAGNWAGAGQILAQAAWALEQAGADMVLLATNTMHMCADQIQNAIQVPFLHIVDCAAQAIKQQGFNKLGLLATRYTMTGAFYKDHYAKKWGIEVFAPQEPDLSLVHDVIYNELCHGTINPASRAGYARIIADLQAKGAQAIILGCTEVGLLVKPTDTTLPLFDTTLLHCQAAVDLALA